MRVLVVALLIHGLAPGLAELAEAAVHYARTGHAAHTAADEGDLGDLGCEHGCGVTQHLCTCCAAQPFAPSCDAAVAALEGSAARPPAPPELALARRAPARPFRPPIS